MGKMLSVEAKQPQEIVDRLARFATLKPENAWASYYYALALWKQRRTPEDSADLPRVKSLLEKAVHRDAKLGPAHLLLGTLYVEQKKLPQAISSFNKAITANPRLPEAHYRLAQAYRQAGEKAKAQQQMQLYQQLSKEAALEVERERSEIQSFVYKLQGQTSTQQP
jgi:lipopolysaccharide biosynthesis regulator YciM